MSAQIDLASILQQYFTTPPGQAVPGAESHYEQAVYQAPRDTIGQGLAAAFRAEQTPPADQMVAQLFGRSNPLQQAGLLNQLMRTLGPVVLASIAGKVMSGLQQAKVPSAGGGDTQSSDVPSPQITPQQAQQVTPQQISEITKRATEQDPTVLDRLGGFYAQHPDLVKTLGGAALTVALAKMAQGMRQG